VLDEAAAGDFDEDDTLDEVAVDDVDVEDEDEETEAIWYTFTELMPQSLSTISTTQIIYHGLGRTDTP